MKSKLSVLSGEDQKHMLRSCFPKSQALCLGVVNQVTFYGRVRQDYTFIL